MAKATKSKAPKLNPLEAYSLLMDAQGLIEEATKKIMKAQQCNKSLDEYYGYSIQLVLQALSEAVYGRGRMTGIEEMHENCDTEWQGDGTTDDDDDDEVDDDE